MKGKKLLAGMLSAAMVLGTMVIPAFADDGWDDGKTVKIGDTQYSTLSEAIIAANTMTDDTVTIDCKDGADLGYMRHAGVKKNLTINGNGAYISSGEGDLSFDMQSADSGMPLESDTKVVVNNLGHVGAWGTRFTNYNLTVEFNNCNDMYEVFFWGDTGTNNIKLDGCSFDGTKHAEKATVHTGSKGNIEINNTKFDNVDEPIKINNKSGDEQIVTIKNSTFTDCGLGDVETGAPISFRTVNDGATTNATVEGCTFTYSKKKPNTGDVLLGTVQDGKDCTPNVTATISGNTSDVKVVSSKSASNDEQIKNIVQANNTATVEMTAVAAINGVKYATLKDAVAAAQDGDTITIIGKVAVKPGDLPAQPNNKNLTFEGDGDDELTFVDGTGYNMYYANGSSLTFNNLTLTWKDHIDYQGIAHTDTVNYNNCTINGQLTLYGASEKFNVCTFVQKADDHWAHNIWTWGAKESEFTNCVFRCRGKSINVYGGGESTTKDAYLAAAAKKLTIDGCEFYVEDKVENCDASAIMIKTRECPYDINIKNSTATGFVTGKMSGQQLYDIKDMRTDVDATEEPTTVKINGGSVDLAAVKEAIKNGSTTPSEAKPVLKIAFVKNDTASDEDSHVYDIKVVSDSDINELNTAELTFDFATDKANEYTITPAEDIVLTGDNANANHYMFSFKNGAVRKTDKEITIGQATVTGYGKYTLKVDDTAVSVVNATTLAANLVDTYATDSSADGKLDVANSTTDVNGEKQEIKVPTRKLAVKISMNNKVEDQKKSYQDMKVEIAGGDYTETIALGSDALAQINKVYTVERELPINTAYTVTISGAGYRTARYTVNLTENKTLNFWNNVAENAIEVELGNDTYKKDVTFLAGDIVKDNSINIYDLSAVVSYFGTDNLVDAHPEYAKYDLNRDGKIDSKDVAYVLVSWGK